jgi:DNA polymerase-3 subunit alpha
LSSSFVHLHVHTEASKLDGLNKIKDIPAFCKNKLGMNALSISDHGNVSGTYRFYKECKSAGIKPILGCEFYYTSGDRRAREKDELGKAFYHIIVLALNNVGLKNLFKLSSASFETGFYYKNRADKELLFEYQEGLAITTGCLGSRTSRLINSGQPEAAERWLREHHEVFGDRMLAEFQLHSDPEQQTVNRELLKLSDKIGITPIVTNDSHYTTLQDKPYQQLLLNMNTDGESENFSFDKINVHLADHDWMLQESRKAGLPDCVVSNTQYVADMVDADSYFSDRMNRYPTFRELPEDVPSHVALGRLCKNNLNKKFNGSVPQEYKDRLEYELRVIKKLGFADYMLTLWRMLGAVRELGGMASPGRGSAAGSLVAYSLGITAIDPIRYGLLFTRFINEGRGATPLIFSHDMRKHLGGHCEHKH